MDQQAFRQLLSTPRSDHSPPKASGHRPRQFGKPNKRVTNEGSSNASELLPRKVGRPDSQGGEPSSSKSKSVSTNSATGDTYVDRAEARRLGRQDGNDFKEVEALMEDFEKRINEAHNDEERERLREQMNYLGGDAKHSVLVKGLDYALLAQQKAKLTGDQGLDDDNDLEGAYGSAATKQDDTGKAREEKVAASKFRPIGSSTGSKHVEKTEEAPEFIWRNGKRMRRKKKKPVAADEQQQEGGQVQPTPPLPSRQSESSRQAAKMSQAVTDSVTMPPPPSKAAKAVQDPDSKHERLEADQKRAKVEADQDGGHERLPERVQEMAPDEDGGESSSSGDDGADIFADAGRWNGLEDDSDDEDTAEIAAAAPAPSEAHVGPATRDWFSTDAKATEAGMDNATEQEVSVLPSSLSSILDTAQAAQESNAAQDGTSEEGDSDDGEEVVAARPERLEGFSDSVLGREGVRYMLEQKDDDKRGEQKRKRKRSRKGKGGYGSD